MDDIKAVPIGAEKYDYMVNLVHELRKYRNSEVLTQKVLDPFFKTPFDDKDEVEEWLMSALRNDDTFVHAYNCMVEDQNFTGYRFDKKFVSERQLHTLLLEEQEEEVRQNSLSEQEMLHHNTASKILDLEDSNLKQELLKIYEKAIEAKVIECTDESFLYWFGGRRGKPHPKISWIKLNNRGEYHKNAFFWFCKKINPDMKAKEMTEICGTKINTNNKNYTPENEVSGIFK
ncbi:hypothetical protein [Tangfeifania diversioriginum]|nr:hypothetical protein [Tangfeifania diversioriginum]